MVRPNKESLLAIGLLALSACSVEVGNLAAPSPVESAPRVAAAAPAPVRRDPELDKDLYLLAYDYEQAGDRRNARKGYFNLIQTRPDSKYVPNAYLAFAEMFFDEAQGDPSKWVLARQAYEKVTSYPPPGNEVYGYAWYKLAYVFWNTSEFDRALDAFKKTIDFGTTYSDRPNATRLAESARRDIIPVYAQAGDPRAAYDFFRAVSGDPPGQKARTLGMMKALGQAYSDIGHAPEADALAKELVTSSSAP